MDQVPDAAKGKSCFTVADRVDATYDEHAAILTAILKNRVQEAQRLVRAHIEHSKIEVRKITLDALHEARFKRLSINF